MEPVSRGWQFRHHIGVGQSDEGFVELCDEVDGDGVVQCTVVEGQLGRASDPLTCQQEPLIGRRGVFDP